MVRRAIFLIRQAGNGGMLLFAEPEFLEDCACEESPPLRSKYRFTDGPARERYRTAHDSTHRRARAQSSAGPGGSGAIPEHRDPEVTRA